MSSDGPESSPSQQRPRLDRITGSVEGMVGTRLCWAVALLVTFAAALVAKSEHAVGDGFDGFVQSLSACKTRTQGDGKRLVCVTAEVQMP